MEIQLFQGNKEALILYHESPNGEPAIVQYQRKHSKILATIFLLLPTVLNSRVSHYSGRSHYFSPHNKLLPFRYLN